MAPELHNPWKDQQESGSPTIVPVGQGRDQDSQACQQERDEHSSCSSWQGCSPGQVCGGRRGVQMMQGAASQTKMAWWAWDQAWCPQDPPGQMGPGVHGILTQKHQADQTRETTAGCSQSTLSVLTAQGPGTRSCTKWAKKL